MIWLLLTLTSLVRLSAGVASFKSYSVSSPTHGKTRSKLLDSGRDTHERSSISVKKPTSDTHVFSVEIPEVISDGLYDEILDEEMESLAHRLGSMDSFMSDSKSKLSLNKDVLLASFISFPFGWTTYSLLRDHDDDVVGLSESDAGEHEVVLRTSSLNNDNVIEFKAIYRRDRTIQCVVEANMDLDKKERKALLAALRQMWSERVVSALMVVKTRVKQSKRYRIVGEAELKRRQERRLDRVINPEKYKSQSPTVRRTGGNGGRYDPGASARERMNAKRQTRIVRRGGGG